MQGLSSCVVVAAGAASVVKVSIATRSACAKLEEVRYIIELRLLLLLLTVVAKCLASLSATGLLSSFLSVDLKLCILLHLLRRKFSKNLVAWSKCFC